MAQQKRMMSIQHHQELNYIGPLCVEFGDGKLKIYACVTELWLRRTWLQLLATIYNAIKQKDFRHYLFKLPHGPASVNL